MNIDDSTCAFAHEQNDYYTLWKQLSLFTQKQHQSAQSGEGAQALYHDKRLKDETDLSSISWALEAQGMAATLSGLFPSALGYAYKPKTHAKHLWFHTKTQNICPEPLLWYRTHVHTGARTQSTSVCASANRSVPSGITVQLQAMEVKTDSGSL